MAAPGDAAAPAAVDKPSRPIASPAVASAMGRGVVHVACYRFREPPCSRCCSRCCFRCCSHCWFHCPPPLLLLPVPLPLSPLLPQIPQIPLALRPLSAVLYLLPIVALRGSAARSLYWCSSFTCRPRANLAPPAPPQRARYLRPRRWS